MIQQLILLLALVTLPLSSVEPFSPNALGFQLIADADPLVSPYTSTNEEVVAVKMVAEDATLQPGKSTWLAFQFTMGDGWHLYWKNPGDVGQAPEVSWTLPEGYKVSDLMWPAPSRIAVDDSVLFGYSNKLTLLAELFVPENAAIGSTATIKADVDWLGCSTACVPGKASFTLDFAVTQAKEEPVKQVAAIFTQAKNALPKALKATSSDGVLEMTVSEGMPFTDIKGVFFFLEEPEIIDSHQMPTWELSEDKKTLTVRMKSDKLQGAGPLHGVLVVEEASALGTIRASWNVAVQAKAAPQISNVEEHLEALEHNVWYRRLLTEVSLFLRSDFTKILIWAFLGGMILNVMPCVLPVISLKVLHFVQLKNVSRMTVVKHGIMYSFGVLISFWLLSAAIYTLQSFGHVIGWGFQLQEPLFVAFLVIVLFILALSLFGVFEFGVSLSSTTGAWEQAFTKRIPTASEAPSFTSSFASGVLATFVAAPCTGPLLGSAIGFAATLEPTYSFAIFSALGLGMAFPFLLLSLFPGLIQFLPKPGRWMVTFKQLMGFFMLATVLWLVWVLDAQTAGLSTIQLLISMAVIALGAWVYGNWCGYDRTKRTRLIAGVVAALVVVAGSWLLFSDVLQSRHGVKQQAVIQSQVVGKEWERFSFERLERLVKSGVPVFVDVTAKWCLTCQTNHLVLESAKVKEAFIQYGVVKMKADWTMNDENITRYIRSLGRNGVPVYAVYSRNNMNAVVLPEVITQEIVLDALKKAHAK